MTEPIAAALEELGLPGLPERLPAPVADSHTHYNSSVEMSGISPELAIRAAAQVNVTRTAQIGFDLPGSRFSCELAANNPSVIAAVAIHPNDAATLGDDLPQALAGIEELLTTYADQDWLRAVGETGMDRFRTRTPDGIARQQTSFAAHIAWCHRFDKTLVIHDRDAHSDILSILDAEGVPNRVIMHCFSGDADFARACLDRGAWLSFPGTVTFKPNHHLREALAITPDDKVLVETDAPFLTPEPLRGRRNSPYLLPITVRYTAAQRGIDPEDTDALADWCDQLLANTYAAFNGPWGGSGAGGSGTRESGAA